MTPLKHFEQAWIRCDHINAMHAYLAANVVGVLKPDELLRAEWVARVSALDLYVHELVAQRMVAIFQGVLPKTGAYNSFMVSSDTLHRIRGSTNQVDACAAFDLEVRRQLGFLSYQYPEKIADGIRMCSSMELWNSVAVHQGATPQNKVDKAKFLKRQLTSIIDRRNKIAHEGDLQPGVIPITAWPIKRDDLQVVSKFIEDLVNSVDSCI